MVTIHPNLTTLDVKGERLVKNSILNGTFHANVIFAAGQVTIDLFIEKETNFIVLHIQDLNVTEKVSPDILPIRVWSFN